MSKWKEDRDIRDYLMRDKLIHEYFGVDIEIIWNTIHSDLSPRKKSIERIITDLYR